MTDARRILAVLANPRAREAYARVVLGHATPEPTTSRERRALEALLGAGLVERSGADGGFVARAEPFEEALGALPRPVKRTGVDRFLTGERIEQYPANPEARLELLEWVASRAIAEHEVLDEREIGERLSRHTDDVAVLRRYLVDAGLLLRTRSGSSYSRSLAP
ncbi:DUF2087 domain-containing protein [Antiquaquibacter soli]|uniref:DUF2087 domain-containing protein n=1 Tax=Antiquaquibacter soli TaxID=3064523 RepID=A0ABT9BNI8_9MICO|nr:DUF2087 domain-containing protein [Protaetiibacter sp. WY-16]MDO7882602.1 DUF2087 domain-containing protein [Protaetiibacter sp. WY-16]